MSKSTLNTAFRKLDVDQYNEDNYREDEVAESQLVRPDEQQVNNWLNKSKPIEALKIVLRDAPFATKNQQIKDSSFNLAMRVLLATKTSQMEEAISSLDSDQIDTLMKYIYRGFENPSEGSSAHLLAWHERTFAVGGLGSIIRVLTDRKRV